jgi:serine/threonine-protein kinase
MSQGTILGGKYRLTQRIGRGAMGQVWAAIHVGLSRHVAIKLMVASHPELKLRLLREAQACGRLKHPNIVEVLDVGETPEGDPYLVMELLSGQTLGQYVKSKFRLDQAEAARIGRDVAKALVAAHGAGIIHRDIKPANIFLHEADDGDGGTRTVVKVVDFGVAKNLEGDADGMTTKTGGMVGSPAYMSPEQVQGKRDIDVRSDLWAVGVVLFEMLTGKRPFDGTEEQITIKILVEQAPLVSTRVRTVSPGLVQLVARCMERDRDKRIVSAQQLVEMLLPFCDASAKGAGQDGTASSPASLAAAEPPRSLAFAPLSGAQLPSVASVGSSDDDDDRVATARIEPDALRKVMAALPPAGRPAAAPPPRPPAPPPARPPSQPTWQAQGNPFDDPRMQAPAASGGSGTMLLDPPARRPPESASGTMPLDNLGVTPAPLGSGGTLPLDPAVQAQVRALRDQAERQAPPSAAFGRQPQPSSGEMLPRGMGGTMRMDPLGSLLPPAPPLAVPPAPPPPSFQEQPSFVLGKQTTALPPSASISGPWQAQAQPSPFAPLSERSGGPVSAPMFGPPPDGPGSTSTTGQLVPARAVEEAQSASGGDAGQRRRRRVGVGIVAGVLVTAVAILTTVVLGKLVGRDAGKEVAAATSAAASVSTVVAAAVVSSGNPAVPADAGAPADVADAAAPTPEATAPVVPPVKVRGPMPVPGKKTSPPKPPGKKPPFDTKQI